jgi:hypothetical protein
MIAGRGSRASSPIGWEHFPLYIRRTRNAIHFASDFVELWRISGTRGDLDWVGLTELYDVAHQIGDRTANLLRARLGLG